MSRQWYLLVEGKSEGPMPTEEVILRLRSGKLVPETLAFGQGMAAWTPVSKLAELNPAAEGAFAPPAPPAGGRTSHEIEYKIHGEEMQFVEIELDPGETVVAEAGAMMHMDEGIRMETRMGDGSKAKQGLFDSLLSAGKRLLTRESLFMTWFTAEGSGKRRVAFASPYPGSIIPFDLSRTAGGVVCQKDSFLCAARGTSIDVEFTQRLGAGFFGGEGFIMQRLKGDGLAFLHAGGTVVEKKLEPGQRLKVDTGCLVAFTHGVEYDVEMVKGVGSILFGGEGLFLVTLTGPGTVWLQSLPFSRLADRIYSAAPQLGRGRSVEEGSVLGGLGDILRGD